MANWIDFSDLLESELLDLKFEGYKLSLDSVPVLKHRITGGVESFQLKGDDYGYLPIHMSSFLNQLFQDPCCLSCVFFISDKRYVFWSCLQQDGRLAEPRIVWQLPTDGEQVGAIASISFPSAEWAVVSNGSHAIYLINTPSRAAGEPWLVCHTYCIEKYDPPCYLPHSLHRVFLSGQQIDCLIAHVCHPNCDNDRPGDACSTSSFRCALEWLSFSCGQNIQVWKLKRSRKFIGKASPKYAALEPNGNALCIGSTSDFRIIFDSEKPVEQGEVEEKSPDAPLYTFIQTPEDITVVFRISDKLVKSDVQVMFQPLHLDVLIRGESVLKGQLCNAIDVSASTWIIEKEKLELSISKAEAGLMWQELLKGNIRGEEIMDHTLVQEIHKSLAHLTSETEVVPSDRVQFNLQQLEECDTCNESFMFSRIDGESYLQTHRAIIGGHQWLFHKQICPESYPFICLRYDVDGIIWQPKNATSEGELDHFKMSHIATFSALGYVLASKQDKKFASCSPDFRFAAVADCSRHVYIYCQPENLHSALELRNRKTGESISHIAKQYVVSLDNCDKILGLCIEKECIFVLSDKMLYALKMTNK